MKKALQAQPGFEVRTVVGGLELRDEPEREQLREREIARLEGVERLQEGRTARKPGSPRPRCT